MGTRSARGENDVAAASLTAPSCAGSVDGGNGPGGGVRWSIGCGRGQPHRAHGSRPSDAPRPDLGRQADRPPKRSSPLASSCLARAHSESRTTSRIASSTVGGGLRAHEETVARGGRMSARNSLYIINSRQHFGGGCGRRVKHTPNGWGFGFRVLFRFRVKVTLAVLPISQRIVASRPLLDVFPPSVALCVRCRKAGFV